MVKLSTMMMMLMSLLLGVLIGVGAKTIAVKMYETPDQISSEQQQPKKTVVISFEENQQDEFFAQIRRFAEKWDYAIRIAPTGSDSKGYLIQMWREDIKIIAVNNFGPGRFSIGFFETYPTRPVPQQYFDEEVSDLKNFIDEIPGATLSVEK